MDFWEAAIGFGFGALALTWVLVLAAGFGVSAPWVPVFSAEWAPGFNGTVGAESSWVIFGRVMGRFQGSGRAFQLFLQTACWANPASGDAGLLGSLIALRKRAVRA